MNYIVTFSFLGIIIIILQKHCFGVYGQVAFS